MFVSVLRISFAVLAALGESRADDDGSADLTHRRGVRKGRNKSDRI